MGRKKGNQESWGFIRPRGGKLLAHALDPHTHTYRAKTFPGDQGAQAEAWAKDMHSKLRLKIETTAKGAATQTQSVASLRSIADAFFAALDLAKGSEVYRAQVGRTIDHAVANGINNLDSPTLVEDTIRVLTGLKTRRGTAASDATRNNFLKDLRTVANYGMKIDRIGRNPFKRVDKIPLTVPLKEVFTIDELRAILDDKNADDPFYLPFASMIYTGFRKGEMQAMDWSWFRWDSEQIRMSVAVKDRARTGLNTAGAWKPKNRRFRTVLLQPEYRALMQPRSYVTDLATGERVARTGRVFPEVPTTNNGVVYRFNALLKRAGVKPEGRTPHSCRHTWVSLMLASGESDLSVKQFAGHSEVEMTEHYGQSRVEFIVQVRREGWKPGEFRLRTKATVDATQPAAAPVAELSTKPGG